MELTLKNVGIIKDSTIKLDGLTVITGPNNSGKSTAGKALYSIIEGASNVAEKREKELTLLFSRILWNINRTLNLSAISRDIDISSFDERDREWVEFFEGWPWGGTSPGSRRPRPRAAWCPRPATAACRSPRRSGARSS